MTKRMIDADALLEWINKNTSIIEKETDKAYVEIDHVSVSALIRKINELVTMPLPQRKNNTTEYKNTSDRSLEEFADIDVGCVFVDETNPDKFYLKINQLITYDGSAVNTLDIAKKDFIEFNPYAHWPKKVMVIDKKINFNNFLFQKDLAFNKMAEGDVFKIKEKFYVKTHPSTVFHSTMMANSVNLTTNCAAFISKEQEILNMVGKL